MPERFSSSGDDDPRCAGWRRSKQLKLLRQVNLGERKGRRSRAAYGWPARLETHLSPVDSAPVVSRKFWLRGAQCPNYMQPRFQVCLSWLSWQTEVGGGLGWQYRCGTAARQEAIFPGGAELDLDRGHCLLL